MFVGAANDEHGKNVCSYKAKPFGTRDDWTTTENGIEETNGGSGNIKKKTWQIR